MSTFFIETATIRAFIRLKGATRESTKDAISLLASSRLSAYFAIGEDAESVTAMTFAPLCFAKSRAFTVCLEYLGNDMPIITSLSSMCIILSKSSEVVIEGTIFTLGNTRER